MNVLLVAALPIDVTRLRTALEAGGATVTHVNDPASGLAALDGDRFDAVVLAPPDEAEDAIGFVRAVRVRIPDAIVLGFTEASPATMTAHLLDAGIDHACATLESLSDQLAASIARSPDVRRLERDLAQARRALEDTRSRLDEATRRSVEAFKGATVLGLVRGVCHEINNPLTGILGYAQLLQETTEGSALEDIKEIEICAQRCRDLVGRLARFCGIERAEAVLLDLNPLVEDALSMIDYAVKRGRLRTEVSLAPDLSQVRGHALELRQAILAVLVHGVQAMTAQRGGTLTVRTHRDGDRVHLEVSDTATGIETAHLARLFDPFDAPPEGGADSGLRLAAARAIIAAHEGRITVSGGLAAGATFVITLPAGDAPCAQTSETLSVAPV